MRKLLLLLLLCLLLLATTACSDSEPDPIPEPDDIELIESFDRPENGELPVPEDKSESPTDDPLTHQQENPADEPRASSASQPQVEATEPDVQPILEIQPSTYDSVPERVTGILSNTGSDTYYTGLRYAIEQFVDGKWVVISHDFPVDDVLDSISSGTSREYSFYLFPDQIDYVTGTYRIVKDDVAAEFTIDLD